MTELIFDKKFFDDDENWEKSEVMREFVNLLEQELTSENKDSPLEAEHVESAEDDRNYDVDVVIEFLPNFELTSGLEHVAQDLKKIAVDSVKYGNEKATFEIEKVSYLIDEILMKVNSGDL